MTLYGKGFFIWQIPRCENGDPAAIAVKARAADLSHVLIKIADGPNWPYNFDFDKNIDLVPPVREALKASGIQVWGWHYVKGEDPINEARLAVRRTRELGLDGYVIDAEGEYKRPGKRNAASRFMQELRLGLPNLPIALCSYRFPNVHKELPWAEFLDRCDYAMPQVYFEYAHNPEQQLERCVEQYMALKPARPVIPVAPAYARSGWRPTAEDITKFFEKAKGMGLTATNAWSWDYATRESYIDMWEAVATFYWTAKPPIADMPERLVGRMNQHSPEHVSGLYADNAAHVTGARTVLGKGPVAEWYRVLFSKLLPNGEFRITGKSGTGRSRHFTWRAQSDTGEVLDGNDTLGLINNKIQYHYTYFTVT